MLRVFRNLPLQGQNFILGLLGMVIAVPMYIIPNMIYGERPGISFGTFADNWLPFAPWTILGYALIYVFVFLPLFTVKDREILWRVIFGFLLCSLVALPFFIFLPVRVPRPGIPTQESFFYWGVALNYMLDKPVNCFPSLHVANAVFAVACCVKLSRRVGLWGMAGAAIIAVSTITLRQHFIADIVAGAALALLSYFTLVHPVIIRRLAEAGDTLTFPPQTALWVLYMYGILIGICILLYAAGMRFQPVLPAN
jgi:membrane-associated phospholipid phosphatase